jgi:hypothetical protein
MRRALSAKLAFEPFYRDGFPGKHVSFKIKHAGSARTVDMALPCKRDLWTLTRILVIFQFQFSLCARRGAQGKIWGDPARQFPAASPVPR